MAKIRIDLLIATFALVSASIVAAYAYNAVLAIEHPPQTFLSEIAAGSSRYAVMYQDECVGIFVTDLQTKPGMVLKTSGNLQLSYRGNSWHTEFFAAGYFNPLGQLVGANLSYTSPGVHIEASSQNANPIDVQLLTTYREQSISHSYSMPGPLLLDANSNGTYRLEYARVWDELSQVSHAMQSVGNGGPQLSLSTGEKDLAACNPSPKALPLDSFMKAAEAQLESFGAMAESILGENNLFSSKKLP